jgi:hypothetical protein
MEDSIATNNAAAPATNKIHVEPINKEEAEQEEVQGGSKVNGETQPSDTIQHEKAESTTQEITPTKSLGVEPVGKDYSIFGPIEKKFIVFVATMGAFFSPFTTQIYFPALTSIAKDLHVSNSKINLTMTTYMVRYPLTRCSSDLLISLDIASHCSGIYREPFRYCRPTPSLYRLFRHIYCCGYRSCSPEQLCCLAHPSNGPISRLVWYCGHS